MAITKYLQENLREYLRPPWPLLVVAFSGGRDSVALLHALWSLQGLSREAGGDFALLAAHFNHRLRGAEADADQEFCQAFCCGLGVEFVSAQASDWSDKHDLENRARQLRYAWLEEICQQEEAKGFQPVWLLTAHHQEDQAETVLLHLLRGSGTAGLAAMRPKTGRLLRPLLAASREEIAAYLAAHNLSWREDSTNAGLEQTRNLLRNRLLPQLKQINPRLSGALAQTAEVAAAEADFLADCVAQRMQQATVLPGEAAAYPLAEWQREPLAIRRLLVRALWQAARQSPVCGLSFEQTEAVLKLPLHKTMHLAGSVQVVKNRGWLRFFCLSEEERQRRAAKSRAGQAKKTSGKE